MVASPHYCKKVRLDPGWRKASEIGEQQEMLFQLRIGNMPVGHLAESCIVVLKKIEINKRKYGILDPAEKKELVLKFHQAYEVIINCIELLEQIFDPLGLFRKFFLKLFKVGIQISRNIKSKVRRYYPVTGIDFDGLNPVKNPQLFKQFPGPASFIKAVHHVQGDLKPVIAPFKSGHVSAGSIMLFQDQGLHSFAAQGSAGGKPSGPGPDYYHLPFLPVRRYFLLVFHL